ncbi:MAG: DUF3488 domain-containing protein [Acidimicrobiia bacterium]|nr:DUF3488 domain-containing protein [Acidimicrobiia bacterium]
MSTKTQANWTRVWQEESHPLEGPFETATDLLTAIGFGILASAGQIPAPIGFLFLALFLPRFHPRFAARFHIEHRLGNLLSWIYVPLFLLDIFQLSGSFVPATLHLILFIQLVRSYQPSKQDRDYVDLLILSFLQVLAASSLTIDLSFLLLFSLYLLVALGALMAFEMKRAAERARPQDLGTELADQPRPASTVSELWSPTIRRQAVRSLALVSLGSFLAIAVLGSGLFFAIPRVGSGYFQRVGRSSSLSGFSDTIRLGGIGTIQLDPAVVMRVRVTGDPALLKSAKWRGVTLDYFDGRSWSKQARRGHCEYFASAMVVLLRMLHVPARIVNGFQTGEYNDVGETFVFRGRDAHSWVEAWIEERGWIPFDPTPAAAEPLARSRFSAVLGNYLDAFDFFWVEWVVGYDDAIQLSFFRDLQDKASQWSWQGQQGIYRSAVQWYRRLQELAARAVRSVKESPASIVTPAALLLALGLALAAGWRMQERRWMKRALRHNPASLAARFYGEFLNLAAKYGSPKPAAATASEFAAMFENSHVRRQVQELTAIYQLLRFSPYRPTRENELRRATGLIREIERHARTQKALP